MTGFETPGLPLIVPVGTERFAVDVANAAGAAPQVGAMTLNQIGAANNFRNLLEGADFTINPWQRGTTFTGISNTLTYGADRWAAKGGASSSISMSRQTVTGLTGYQYALQFGRAAANADTAALSLIHVLETADCIRLQGQPLVLSWLAQAGALFSAAGGVLTLTVYTGTSTNDTANNMLAGSWTGQKTLFTGTFALTPGGGWPVGLSYQSLGIVPANATQIGLTWSFTPVGTAGATDWVQFVIMQLETGTVPSQFERRDVQVELELCQRYCMYIAEPANNVLVAVGGVTATANNQNFVIATPVQMQKAPTVTVSAGSWKVAAGAAAAAATGFAAGTTHTPSQITVVSTLTQTVGGAAHLQGGGGAGFIQASADY